MKNPNPSFDSIALRLVREERYRGYCAQCGWQMPGATRYRRAVALTGRHIAGEHKVFPSGIWLVDPD